MMMTLRNPGMTTVLNTGVKRVLLCHAQRTLMQLLITQLPCHCCVRQVSVLAACMPAVGFVHELWARVVAGWKICVSGTQHSCSKAGIPPRCRQIFLDSQFTNCFVHRLPHFRCALQPRLLSQARGGSFTAILVSGSLTLLIRSLKLNVTEYLQPSSVVQVSTVNQNCVYPGGGSRPAESHCYKRS